MAKETSRLDASPLPTPEKANVPACREGDAAGKEEQDSASPEQAAAVSWRDINRIAFVAAAAGAVLLLRGDGTALYAGISALCTLLGGYPIFRKATENILERRMTITRRHVCDFE